MSNPTEEESAALAFRLLESVKVASRVKEPHATVQDCYKKLRSLGKCYYLTQDINSDINMAWWRCCH